MSAVVEEVEADSTSDWERRSIVIGEPYWSILL